MTASSVVTPGGSSDLAAWATAGATFFLAVVALFQDWFRAYFFTPRLRLALINPNASQLVNAFIKVPPPGPGVSLTIPTRGRWYYLQLVNLRRYIRSATNVRVYLTRIAIPNDAGDFVDFSTGPIPLGLRNEGQEPRLLVGPSKEWDFCGVYRQFTAEGGDHVFKLHTTLETTLDRNVVIGTGFNQNNLYIRRFTFIGQSVEADSNEICVEITWDGQWSDDNEEMGRHLIVREWSEQDRERRSSKEDASLWKWLPDFVMVLGLLFTLAGAFAGLRAVRVTHEQAIEIGVMRLNGNNAREDLQLPPVQNLLRQSTWAQRGFGAICIGSVLQIVAVSWARIRLSGRRYPRRA